MANCGSARGPGVCFFLLVFFIFGISLMMGKPLIGGSGEIEAELGQNVSIDCWGNKSLIWFKFVNKTQDMSVIDEEGKTSHFDLELPEYTDWPDPPDGTKEKHLAVLNLLDVEIKDEGLYVCSYELGDIEERIRKNKKRFFSFVRLTIKINAPVIDVGPSIVLSQGQSINITCSGEKPVSWVLMNNHTWGTEHVENENDYPPKYMSVLEIVNVNHTDVGYLVCKFQHNHPNLYEDFDHESNHDAASTYLFVKDENHLLVPHESREIIALLNSNIVVPCKPTFPEVNVSLTALDNTLSSDRPQIPNSTFDPKEGYFIAKSSKKYHDGFWECSGVHGERYESHYIFIRVHYSPFLSNVSLAVEGAWQINSLRRNEHVYDVVQDDVLLLNCSTEYMRNFVTLMWQTPQGTMKDFPPVKSNETKQTASEVRMIPNVSAERDAGVYSCYVTNGHVNSTVTFISLNVFAFDSAHLELKAQKKDVHLLISDEYPALLKWILFFRAYPELNLNWTRNGESKIFCKIDSQHIDHARTLVKRKDHYEIKVNWLEGEITLIIHSPTIRDTGTYVLFAEVPGKHSIMKNITIKFFKEGPPEEVRTKLLPSVPIKTLDQEITIICAAYGFRLVDLKVLFKACNQYKNCHIEDALDIKTIRPNLEVLANSSAKSEITGERSVSWIGVAQKQGFYFCVATNRFGSTNSSVKPLIISDSEFEGSDFLQIEIQKNRQTFLAPSHVSFIQGDNVVITCRGNNFTTTTPLVWTINKGSNSSIHVGSKSFIFQDTNVTIEESRTPYSLLSQISTEVTKKMNGIRLICSDSFENSREKSVNISVIDATPPTWISDPLGQDHFVRNENEKLSLLCAGNGVPEPSVTWLKDDQNIKLDKNSDRISVHDGLLSFKFLFPEDSGKYTCKIENREGSIEDFVTLEIIDPDAAPHIFLIVIIGVVSFLFLILVIILAIKFYRERKAEQLFKLEVQKRFNEGNPECLNPDLDLGEQADLLPYDNKFEFPRERVTIENLLGSGAFGNVFKATAIDLISGASKTTVAVKMMKSPANPSQMKTLISELKIMIHIGRHINIVNLLGACSKNMASKGELLLIVEYCRYGSILEYMRQNKEEFEDQINQYDKIDPSMKYYRRRTHSNSRAPQRMTYAQLDLHRNSTYLQHCISNNSVNGRVSFIDSSSTENSGRRRFKSENGAIYESVANRDVLGRMADNSAANYISASTLEQRSPLCSKDLLHWSYQIANGMFYLSEKKVIHGDLAARNILLADNNVVKISDFGLSKNIYKKEHYKKKSQCPLPVKWLALEALNDSIFSTHSDVWSYGVVLWEIFSLGANPYAGVEVDANFIVKLEEGLRLSHPTYATTDLYNIMMRCWQKNPNDRPSFRELEKLLGDMLGDTEKQMYMTLNADNEENNFVSEHLQFLNTPTYDSRVRVFFTEKDQFGYEKAISSPIPGIIMEKGTDVIDGQNSLSENQVVLTREGRVTSRDPLDHFVLDPVPKRKKSNLERNLSNDQREMKSLLRERPESEYLVMNPTFNEKGSSRLNIEENNTVTYANISKLNDNQNREANLNNSYPPLQTESLSQYTTFQKTEPEKELSPDIEAIENDCVFTSTTSMNHPNGIINHNQTNQINTNNHSQNIFNHNKHDSGIYSPNIMQVNPLYIQTPLVEQPKLHSPHLQTFHPGEFDLKSNENSSRPTCEPKQRHQSDSSSGFGSLTDDRSNSLEKCKVDNKVPKSTFCPNQEMKCRKMEWEESVK